LVNQWLAEGDKNEPIKLELDKAIEVIELIEKTLELDGLYPWSWSTLKSSLEHLSKKCQNEEDRGMVWVVIKENMNLSRLKADGRLSDDPDGGSGRSARSIALDVAIDSPALILVRENGDKNSGWKDTPFWWPILVNPENMEAVVFAEVTI
ncbi:hypothetical protein IID27_01250, partial [Patescibacteria group bacterium]|nr:hypothetical protein [Patescibacteria group bacterium]